MTFRALVISDVLLLIATALKFLLHQEHSNIVPSPRAASLVALVLATVLCATAAAAWRRRPSTLMWSGVGVLFVVAGGYPASYLRDIAVWSRRNPSWSTNSIVALRYLAERQEDYRLSHGAYCADLSCLGWNHDDGTLTISARGAEYWGAHVILPNGGSCSIRVGDAWSSAIPEGVPDCRNDAFDSYHPHNEFSAVRTRQRASLPLATWHPMIDSAASWPQYRGDSARSSSGTDSSASIAAHWRVMIPGEVRSSISAASGLIVVGTHDNGEVEARSALTGALAWRTRVPNWVHSEAVIAHGEVVVGFGSAADQYAANPVEEPSSPSGIAAFAFADGRRLWQYITRGSVMTSPVIVDSTVVFATGFDEAVAVRLATGKVLWSRKLPGGAVMGSPAAAGGYVYFTLEPDHVCKIAVESGRTTWCHDLGAEYIMTGHAAPAVDHGTVFLSAVNAPEVLLEGFPQVVPAALRYVYHRLVGDKKAALDRQRGQTLFALSTGTGSLLWKTEFAGRERIVGHPAGAPVITPSGVAVVLPTSHTVAVVDPNTGRVEWRISINSEARGPLTSAEGRLIVATPEGRLRILDEHTGSTLCDASLPAGSDRAGPTIYRNTVYVGLLDGTVIADPLDRVLKCQL